MALLYNPLELSDAALDYAVAKILWPKLRWGKSIGLSAHARNLIVVPDLPEPKCYWSPSSNWDQAGEIIEKHFIGLHFAESRWAAASGAVTAHGATALTAAMRCFVLLNFKKGILIPEDLIA